MKPCRVKWVEERSEEGLMNSSKNYRKALPPSLKERQKARRGRRKATSRRKAVTASDERCRAIDASAYRAN